MKHSIVRPPVATALIKQVLDTPELVVAVRALPVETLGALIRAVGLEDAGEIVALATPAQLLGVLDGDLWQAARSGGDEVFDDARFALWLEVLLEAGEGVACNRLLELPEELLTLGFLRQVLVLDMDTLAEEVAAMDDGDVDRVEKALDGCLSQELEQYRVVSRRHDGWDAVVACLLALAERQPDECQRLLERLAVASRRAIDDEYADLSDALDNAEVVASDAAADREDRRAAAGYVSPASAKSFLSLARSTPIEEVLREAQPDPLTRAYFRELSRERPPAAPLSSPLVALLEQAGVQAPARPLLASSATPATRRFREEMEALAERAPALHAARMDELVYLANLLLAGADAGMRVSSLYDAVSLVIEICGLALAHLGERARLDEIGADKLFRVGWWLRTSGCAEAPSC